MPISRRDLHDLLDEHSSPALSRPIPWESLRTRTRGARRRRQAVFAVAGVAVAASVVVAATVVTRPAPPDDREITASSPHQLPATFEEEDGTVYRRVATAGFDPGTARPVTFAVPVTGRPLAVMADCPDSSLSGLQISARVAGEREAFTLTPVPFLMYMCEDHRPIDISPMPKNTGRAHFTIRLPKAARKVSGQTRKWRFAVYEWTPPATMKPAPSPVPPPADFGGHPPEHKLITSKSVTWPATRETTVTVPLKGRDLVLTTWCGGAIGGRVAQEVWVNGKLMKGSVRCDNPPSGRGHAYTVLGRTRPDADGDVSVRVRISSVIPEYERRSGTLTVALYDMRSPG